MSLTINAKTYTADRLGLDSVGYIGPLHTMSSLDVMVLGRTPPKPTPTFSGIGRTSGKLSRTLTLTGALTPTGVGSATFNVSIPVGAASADIDAILNDLGAFIASATYKTIVKNQAINY